MAKSSDSNKRTSNVLSILGMPYHLPHYADSRSGTIKFIPRLDPRDGAGESVTEVGGVLVVFGLVLHRQIFREPNTLPLYRPAWAISEQSTGCRVVTGRTRQDALDTLGELVAYLGGEHEFRGYLDAAVARALDGQIAAATK